MSKYDLLGPTNAFIHSHAPTVATESQDKYVMLDYIPHEETVGVYNVSGTEWAELDAANVTVNNHVVIVDSGTDLSSDIDDGVLKVEYVPSNVSTLVERYTVQKDGSDNLFVNLRFDANEDKTSVFEVSEGLRSDAVGKVSVNGDEINGSIVYLDGGDVSEGDTVEVEYLTSIESGTDAVFDRSITAIFTDSDIDDIANYFSPYAKWFDSSNNYDLYIKDDDDSWNLVGGS